MWKIGQFYITPLGHIREIIDVVNDRYTVNTVNTTSRVLQNIRTFSHSEIVRSGCRLLTIEEAIKFRLNNKISAKVYERILNANSTEVSK